MSLAPMPVRADFEKKGDVFMGTVSLRSITPEDIPLIWKWLNEYPAQNFDDYGPKTLDELEVEIVRRIQRDEKVVIATHNDKPVGVIGYAQENPHRGCFRGICFSKSVHRTGVPAFAVQNFLKIIFNSGIQKVSAVYFSDSMAIKKFLRKLGFGLEGTLTTHTTRHGVLTKMSLVALHKRNFAEKVN